MQIDKLQTLDFQGLQGQREWDLDKINILCQSNGTGKSSFLNAVKYGLTGIEPEGTLIHDGCTRAAVGLTLNDGTKIIRQKTAGNSTCFLDNHKTSKKNVDQAIVNSTGVPMPSIKLASSEEALKAAKPQDFASVILSYTSDILDAETVKSFVPDLTDETEKMLDERLPVGTFGVEKIKEVAKLLDEQRLTLKREITKRENALKIMKKYPRPSESLKDLKKQEAELILKLEKAKEYEKKLEAYNKAFKSKTEQEQTIASYEKRIAENKGIPENEGNRLRFETKLKEERENLKATSASYSLTKKTVEDLNHILPRLDTNICPLSEKLVCTTDKTKIKDELSNTLETVTQNAKLQEEQIKQSNLRIEEYEKAINAFDRNQELLRNKKILEENLAKIKGIVIEVPEKPEKPSEENTKSELTNIQTKIRIHEDLDRAVKIEENLERGYKTLKNFEALTKAFAAKGPVMERISERYMRAFEEVCNEKAEKIKPGMKVKFVAENGVVVYLDVNGTGQFLNYNSLSGGEKAIFVYILMDMMNALSGLNILILDELSVLDNDVFEALLKIIIEHSDAYDQIFLSAVNHDDTLATIKNLGFVPKVI